MNSYRSSLCRLENDYHQGAWKKFMSSNLFVPVSTNELSDLEEEECLDDQFLFQNIPLESFQKPRFEGDIPDLKNAASYYDLKTRYDSILTPVVWQGNEYYSKVMSKLSKYKRQFTGQYFSIYADSDSSDSTPIQYMDFDGHHIKPIKSIGKLPLMIL